jgi:hypothetical protein
MVMGPPYSYERVLADSDRYAKTTGNGKFVSWWETYLRDEGFQIAYRPFLDLSRLSNSGGNVLGLLGMEFTHLRKGHVRKGHVVAVDEFGVVDPAENAPAHVALQDYVLARIRDGAVFEVEFLAVTRSRPST